jgi:molybdopterin/thiamine biosynthesis adenylyltransferase
VNQDKKKGLHASIQEKAASITDPAGRRLQALKDHDTFVIADEYQISVHAIYIEMLTMGIYPYRYIRNLDAISTEEQLKLAESKIAIIGAGGLGGNVILLLARVGIGSLVVVDQDVFDETNLNRQALCNVNFLGMPKANEAASAVAGINPGVEVFPHQIKLDAANAAEILPGSNAIVDALDNIADRFFLEGAARKLGIPLVHGTLAGFEGWVMTIFPGDPGLKNIYGAEEEKRIDRESPQALLGVPGVTPFIIAAFQVMEVLKILLGRGDIFRDRMLHVDLERGCLNEFFFRVPDSSKQKVARGTREKG